MTNENIYEMKEKIKNVEEEIENLKDEVKMKNSGNNKNIRLKSDSNGKSNVNTRVSRNFDDKLEDINKQREELGLNKLSKPKMTELIVKHKYNWKPIEEDIVTYDNEK